MHIRAEVWLYLDNVSILVSNRKMKFSFRSGRYVPVVFELHKIVARGRYCFKRYIFFGYCALALNCQKWLAKGVYLAVYFYVGPDFIDAGFGKRIPYAPPAWAI